ncbi:MAG: hypothetical protein AB3N07_13125 [Ruegeria sp.]
MNLPELPKGILVEARRVSAGYFLSFDVDGIPQIALFSNAYVRTRLGFDLNVLA